MRVTWLFAISALLASFGSGPATLAETPEGTDEPAGVEAPAEPEKKKGFWHTPFSLYLYAGFGGAEPEDVNTSIVSREDKEEAISTLHFDEMKVGRAAIGWKLPNKKGDFRILFNGYREDGYSFHSLGKQDVLSLTSSATLEPDETFNWWTVTIENGMFMSVRRPPEWAISEDDLNGNSTADESEVRPGEIDLMQSFGVTNDLDNQIQHIDVLYGREFGGRRFSGRWWGGLRYYAYEGNLPATAWVGIGSRGESFTDGAFVRMLNLRQEVSGLGPSGSAEIDFNFLDGRVQTYLQASAAFILADLTVDSGPFFALVRQGTAQITLIPAFAQLQENRDKSTWQTGAEIGVRLKLKAGLLVDLAYYKVGFLDTMLLPDELQVPEGVEDIPGAMFDDDGQLIEERVSAIAALYVTHDLVFDGWRAGIGFQF